MPWAARPRLQNLGQMGCPTVKVTLMNGNTSRHGQDPNPRSVSGVTNLHWKNIPVLHDAMQCEHTTHLHGLAGRWEKLSV